MQRIRFITMVSLLAASGGSSLAGQTPAAPSTNPLTDSIKAQYTIVKGYITKAAAMLDEKDYGFKPAGVAPEVRSFGQLVGHIANAQFMLCAGAAGQAMPSGGNYERMTAKADIVKGLEASFAACDKAFSMANDRNPATLPAGTNVTVRVQQPVTVTVQKE